jgi:spermidine synthase
MSMASLLFKPDPERIAIVGLGGGTLPLAFAELFPNAHIDAVEIDPAVVAVAQEFFGFIPTEYMTVHTRDARVWTKRALRKDVRYDIIVLDAFNGEYIPEHLMTREYLQETKDLLAPGGTLVANTFAISDLYDHESATYAAVFGDFINFQVPESANRVIVYAGNDVADEILLERADKFEAALQSFDVPIRRFAKILINARGKRPDWRLDARVLTDQYSPANLLQGR